MPWLRELENQPLEYRRLIWADSEVLAGEEGREGRVGSHWAALTAIMLHASKWIVHYRRHGLIYWFTAKHSDHTFKSTSWYDIAITEMDIDRVSLFNAFSSSTSSRLPAAHVMIHSRAKLLLACFLFCYLYLLVYGDL